MKRSLFRFLVSLPHWFLWACCVLLVVPVLLSVPGNPEPWELWLYFALATAITHYPILLPAFAVMEVRARKRERQREERTYRSAIWVIFTITGGLVATMAAIMYANTPPPRVLTQEEQIEQDYSDAMIHHDMEALRALVEGGADIEHRMFRDGTPASVAALHYAWPQLIYLLEKGADPDHPDMGGHTARTLFERAEPPPGDDDYACAYRRLKEMLAEMPVGPPVGGQER